MLAYNSSLTAYPDIRATLDRALESPKGIRIRFPDKNAALTFRGRCHTMRFLDRKENKKIYPEDNPMHGRSAYDPLMVKREPPVELGDGKWEYPVAVIKLDGAVFDVEEIE